MYAPLYLGKRKISISVFDHHKDEELKNNEVTHLAIHFSGKNTIEKIESLFLHKYSFPLNERTNEEKGLEVLSVQRAFRGRCKNFYDNFPCVHSRETSNNNHHQ